VRAGNRLFDAGIEALQQSEQKKGTRDLQQHEYSATLLAPDSDPNEWQVLHVASSSCDRAGRGRSDFRVADEPRRGYLVLLPSPLDCRQFSLRRRMKHGRLTAAASEAAVPTEGGGGGQAGRRAHNTGDPHSRDAPQAARLGAINGCAAWPTSVWKECGNKWLRKTRRIGAKCLFRWLPGLGSN
jgi:hypothetical protein